MDDDRTTSLRGEHADSSLARGTTAGQGMVDQAVVNDFDGAADEGGIADAEPAARRDQRGPLSDLAAVYRTPGPYLHWDASTTLPDPHEAKPTECHEGLLRIVEVEGPIVGQRLYQLYVKSAGKSHVGSAIRAKLNKATHQMEQKGLLAAEDPLHEGGQIKKTFRLPDQPSFAVRERGNRTIHDIPPLELAARIRALRRSGDSEETMFRRVLKEYGLTKLTFKTRERLQECAALLEGLD